MTNIPRPYITGEVPELLAEYSATTPIGRTVRQADAKLRLQQMVDAEESVCRQELANEAIKNRLEQMVAKQTLDMQYLIQYGVTAAEREQFRKILEEVAEHGGLSLQEAADLAHARDGNTVDVGAA